MADAASLSSLLAGEEGARREAVGRRGALLLDRARTMRSEPTEAERMLWRLLRGKLMKWVHPVAVDQVAVIVVLGWLTGIVFFSAGYAIFILASLAFFEPSIILFFVQLFAGLLFGVGFVSSVWVIPNSFVLVWILRLFDVPRYPAAVIIVGVTLLYGFGFWWMGTEWAWLSTFWVAAPVFGLATAIAYAKVCDA